MATVVAFQFFNRSVVAVGANRSGFFTHLLPVFGTVMAILFLDESVQAFHGFGIALIVLGVSLSTLGVRRPGAPQTSITSPS